MSKPFSYIGKNVPKVDAFDKVTGSVIFGHDMKLPGMLHGKILRSRHAHARIVGIDTRKARSLPGVKAVITAADVKCGNLGFLGDHPVLKGGKVRSYRDEVAAVAAVSEEAAEEACRLIKVKYEPLPAVFDAFEAMKDGAPLIHEDCPGNRPKFAYEFKHGDVDLSGNPPLGMYLQACPIPIRSDGRAPMPVRRRCLKACRPGTCS